MVEGRDDCSRVDFEVAAVDLLHDVIDEQIFFELLLQDENLKFGLDAEEGVETPDFEVLGQNTRVGVRKHHVVVLLGLDLPLVGPHVLLHLQDLEVLLQLLVLTVSLALFYDVEQRDGRVLLLIDAAHNLGVVDVLVLRNLRQTSTDLLVLELDFAVLDDIVVELERTG